MVEQSATEMLLNTGRVQVVHQGDYRYVRVRVPKCGIASADKLQRAFGGYYDSKKREWVASDKGTLLEVASAMITQGCVNIMRIGALLMEYAESPVGQSTPLAQRIAEHTGRRTTDLGTYWWHQKQVSPTRPSEGDTQESGKLR